MSRRFLVAVAAAAAFAAPLAHAERKAADEECTPRIDVHALFARGGETVDANTIKGGGVDVVIARIGPDGKPVIGCVSTEEAARRFLASPAPARRAEEK